MTGIPLTGFVPVGAYELEAGTRTGSFARFESARDKRNGQALRQALSEKADDERRPLAAAEAFEESASAVTDQVARAETLFQALVEGRVLEPGVVPTEIDGLLDLFGRLDRDGRFEEELRVARVLNALLMLTLRWFDLVRTLRTLLRSASAAGHQSGRAWALHELGSLYLCAGDPQAAEELLRDALQVEEQLGELGARCLTRHNLDCARRDLALRGGLPRLLRLAGLVAVLAVLTGGAAEIANALYGGSHKPGGRVQVSGPTLAPRMVVFGPVALGSSLSKRVTLNAGAGGLTVTRIATDSTQFSASQNCLTTLPRNKSCAILITFAPTHADATASGKLTIETTAASPLAALLSGSGVQVSGPTLAPRMVVFGSVALGSSLSKQVTLNAGAGGLTVTRIATDSTQFSASQSCLTTLPRNKSCAILITFAPTRADATASSKLTIETTAASPLAALLSGSGVQVSGPTLAPRMVVFGSVALGSSLSKQVTLNAGAGGLTVTRIATDSTQFSASQNCLTTLPRNGSCSITVTYTPSGAGTVTATLTINSSGGGPTTDSLSGGGVEASITLKPVSLDFGSVNVGSARSLKVLLSNSGGAPLAISSIVPSDKQFVVKSACPTSVQPGGACGFVVTYTPTSGGAANATVTIDAAANGQNALAVSGSGVEASITLKPVSLDFGSVNVGSARSLKVLLSNSGGAPLAISSIVPSDKQFVVKSACPTSVQPGGACGFVVTYTPTSGGAANATVTIDATANGQNTLAVKGTGV